MIKFAGLATLMVLAFGCYERVPPGYVGMRLDGDGFDGEILQPGRHSCGATCNIILVETQELLESESMKILCADNLNLSIDVDTRSRVKVTDGEGIQSVLNKQGAKMENNRLAAELLYATYVRPQVRSITRKAVSRFSTTQVREKRREIEAEINKDLIAALESTPVEVMMAVTSNMDYPEIITKAEEKKKARQLQIQEEQAKHEMDLLRAENRMKIAEAEKTARIAEAEADAAANRIVGLSATPQYLKLKQIEAQMELYKNVGQGDKVIITGGADSAVPIILNN